MDINYINLTNGIEALPNLKGEIHFIRIQSTVCEQKMWDRLIQELDYDFLMNVAIGNNCLVYDYGANKPIPRAMYQGIEFIKYALYRRWFNKCYDTNIRRSKTKNGQNCNKYFDECYNKMEDRTKKKLDYFKPYLNKKEEINITTVTNKTTHDGDKEYYANILRDYIDN
mgnify:CR=1 FL=1